MSKSNTCTVLCKLPSGVILGDVFPAKDGLAFDSASRVFLDHGVTEDVPRAAVEKFLKINSQLACVRNGSVRILDDADVLAVDSNRKK